MADDIQQLLIALEARADKLEKGMARASAAVGKSWGEIEDRSRRGGKNTENTFDSLAKRANESLASIGDRFADPLRASLAALTAGLSVNEIVKYADAWRSAGNQLVGAGVPLDRLAATQQNVADIAIRSRAEIGATAELYARLSRASTDLGSSQAEVAVVTETVAKGLRLAGASAAESAGSMLQLSQALQSGKLNGDELRSLMESAPLITQAVAREYNVTIGQLKKLGADGKLEAERVFKAIIESADAVNEAFGKTIPTVADAFNQLESQATKFVGTSTSVQTATAGVSAAINLTAANLDKLATGAVALGALLAARLVGAGLTPLLSGLGRAVVVGAATAGSMNALNLTLAATVARANGAALAAAGLSRVLAFVGGPVGAIFLGLGAATLIVSERTAAAEARAKRYAEALEEVKTAAKDSAGAIDDHTSAVIRAAEAQANEQANTLGKGLAETENDVNRFTGQIRQLLTGYASFSREITDPKDVAALRALASGFDGTAESAAATKERLFELANANPNFQAIADKLAPLINRLIAAGAYADQLRSKLATVQSGVAAATDKATEAKITPAKPAATYEDASQSALNDPVLRALRGEGELHRAVAHAEMDKTAREVGDEKKKLVDQIIAGGGTVDVQAAELAAKRIVAAKEAAKSGGGGGGESEDEYARASRRIQEHIDLLGAEAQAIGKTDREREKARTTQELLTAAQQADVTVTDEVRRAIDELAERYAAASDHVKKLTKAQQDSIEAADNFRSATKDVLSGFVADLRQGKTAAEALANVLSRIADHVLDLLIDRLITAMLGAQGSPGLGIFGMIGKLFGFKDGGEIDASRHMPHFAGGGRISGPGSSTSDSVPILASDGEFIVNAKATAKHRGLLEAINSGAAVARYASGGQVGGGTASAPQLVATGGATVSQSFAPVISPTINLTAAGGAPEQNAHLAAQVSKQVTESLRGLVIGELTNQMRHGGVLAKAMGR